MKITDHRKSNGQFKKKSKLRVIFNWAIIVLIVIAIGSLLMPSKTIQNAPEATITQTDGLSAEQIANLQKQADLAKQEQILLNKKAFLENQLKNVENQLGEVRSQKLSFQ